MNPTSPKSISLQKIECFKSVLSHNQLVTSLFYAYYKVYSTTIKRTTTKKKKVNKKNLRVDFQFLYFLYLIFYPCFTSVIWLLFLKKKLDVVLSHLTSSGILICGTLCIVVVVGVCRIFFLLGGWHLLRDKPLVDCVCNTIFYFLCFFFIWGIKRRSAYISITIGWIRRFFCILFIFLIKFFYNGNWVVGSGGILKLP